MLMPMLLAIVLGAILAGQLLSRTDGRYRAQAVVSTVLMAGGMYLYSILSDGGGFAQGRTTLFGQVCVIIAALGFGGVVGDALSGSAEWSPVQERGGCDGGVAVQPLPWAA